MPKPNTMRPMADIARPLRLPSKLLHSAAVQALPRARNHSRDPKLPMLGIARMQDSLASRLFIEGILLIAARLTEITTA